MKSGLRRFGVLTGLACLAFMVLWPGRALLPPIDRDESRYTQATRQMLETGDYLDVRYLDQPRYVQPAGVYWLQAAAVKLTGTENQRVIWPHRLPSFLAGILAVLLTGWIGARLFGAGTGLLGGGLFAASLLLSFEGRIATTDATLLACVMVAEAALLSIWQKRDVGGAGRLAPIILWLALGIGIMVKGPMVLLPVASTVIGLAIAERRWRWLLQTRPLLGIPLMLAIVLPWLIAIGIKTNGQFFALSVGHNLLGKVAAGQEAHAQPPGYYLALFPLTFWPGSLLAFAALPCVWAARRQPAVIFLLSWIIPTWLVFEAVVTKLPHYVLPTFPAIALLAVAPLPKLTSQHWQRIAFIGFAILWGVVGTILSIGLPIALWAWAGEADIVAILEGLVGLCLLAAMLQFCIQGRLRSAVMAGVAASLVVFGSAYGNVVPRLAPMWLSPRIAALVTTQKPCPTSVLAAASYHEPSMVFLLGTDTKLVDAAGAAQALADNRACGVAMVNDASPGDHAAFAARLSEVGVTAQPLGTISGVDYSNGRRMALTVYKAAP